MRSHLNRAIGGLGLLSALMDPSFANIAGGFDAADIKFSFCAFESGRCNFEGRKIVRFGADNSWFYTVAENGIQCTISPFGDPSIGNRKVCQVGDYDTNRAPSLFRNQITTTVNVEVIVIDDGSGLNKQRYSRKYVEDFLSQASLLTNNEFIFNLSDHQLLINKDLYEQRNQQPVLMHLRDHRAVEGRFVVAITNPRTIDATGMTIQGAFIESHMPVIVMRSRLNNGSKEDVIELSRIFLHEFGHTFGFTHEGNLSSKPYNAENWWFVPEIRKFVASRIDAYNNKKSFSCMQTLQNCESSRFVVTDDYLFEYKNGSKPWSKFQLLSRNSSSTTKKIIGFDSSREILIKIEETEREGMHFVSWSVANKDQTPKSWNRIRGMFAEGKD
jgi:hypothetical protein